MTRKDWFIVQNSIIDRNDLNVYEKMCCVVLARYADKEEFDDLLTSDIIAIKMGVESSVAKQAVFGLIEKGLINFEGKTRPDEDEEMYREEVRINSILKEADNENILKSNDSNKKLSMAEFKKRLNLVNAVNDDEIKEIYVEPINNIVRNEEVNNDESDRFNFSDFNFENMFPDDDEVETNDELDSEFEKSLINDDWVEELEKVEDIIQNSNLDDKKIYDGLSEEAKYHLGMLDDQKQIEKISNKDESVVKSAGVYRKKSPSKQKEEYHSLVDQVYEILDETINEREARIILSFADNDIRRIREKYKIAKRSQINDKIEVLINELQKKDISSSTVAQISAEDMEKLPNTQINMANINKMKQYSKYSKK